MVKILEAEQKIMRNGQKHAEEIIRNVNNAELVNPSFLDFLASLGWPVNVWHHTGWTGKMSTSWRYTCFLYRRLTFTGSNQTVKFTDGKLLSFTGSKLNIEKATKMLKITQKQGTF